MGDEKPTYDLEPADTTPAEPPPPPAAADSPRVARVAKLEAPPLVTDEVEEQFDAAEKAAAEAREKAPLAEPAAFVRRGWDQPKLMGAIGGAAAIAAGVMAWVNSPVAGAGPGFARLLLVAYTTGLHAGLGVVAVMLAAFLLGKIVGPIEFAAGRMLLAVGLFQVFVNLKIGSAYPVEEILLGAAAYLGVVFSTFRWKKEDFGVVVAAHFGLWLAMQMGMWLAAWVQSTAPAPPAG